MWISGPHNKIPIRRRWTQAEAAAQRALALNASDPIGHAFLGSVYLWQKQYEQAIAEMERGYRP